MRKMIYCALAAFAAFSAVSCQRVENETPGATTREFTCSFDCAMTKTTLGSDGLTPRWAEGDVIRLMDDTGYEDITLTADDIAAMKGETITVRTNLTGAFIFAVYPASATSMTSCDDSGEIILTIPAQQDGTFAGANICASMNDEYNRFVFHNVASILKISQNPSEGVVGVKVEAESILSGEYHVFLDSQDKMDGSVMKVLLPLYGANAKSVSATLNNAAEDIYIAVASGVETGATKITYIKKDGYASSTKSGKALQFNTMYNLGNISELGLSYQSGRGIVDGHEYVEIAGVKWATENVAITASGKKTWMKSGHATGDFFRWGETNVLYSTFKDGWAIPSNDNDPGFIFIDATTFWNDYSGIKNRLASITDSDNNLTAEYDIATKHWGPSWRMPEGGNRNEFLKLYEATYWAWDPEDLGCYVFLPDAKHPAGSHAPDGDGYERGTVHYGLGDLDKKDAVLYFPGCGWGKTSAVSNTGLQTRLWTRTFLTDDKKVDTMWAKLYDDLLSPIESKNLRFKPDGWFYGYNVRPVVK